VLPTQIGQDNLPAILILIVAPHKLRSFGTRLSRRWKVVTFKASLVLITRMNGDAAYQLDD
jgi:hypothetical protein